jgi:hypothetical protein
MEGSGSVSEYPSYQELATALARPELNSDALQNADDVIQPKAVLPDFVVT